ncbi:MAG: YqaJ viral recombinase family protein [Rickettsiales bacterium]|nr:YqaJ viral recombinase family protein [Rickettsiales bacterium]
MKNRQHIVQPRTPEWHALRRTSIGSSEIAALFGLSPYLTAFELYHAKRGSIGDNFEDTERMFWGRQLEDAIATGAGEQEHWTVINPKGFYQHATIDGMGATPDKFIEDAAREGLGIMEVKNVAWPEFKEKWTDGEPPIHYLLQLQHQLACTGLEWGAIVALVGGNDLKVFRYERHEPTVQRIESAVRKFWQDVQAEREPQIDDAAAYAVVKELHPVHDSEIDLTGDNQLPTLCADALRHTAERLAAQKAEDAAKAEILRRVGSNARAKCNGFWIERKEIVAHLKAQEARTQTSKRLTIKEMTQ